MMHGRIKNFTALLKPFTALLLCAVFVFICASNSYCASYEVTGYRSVYLPFYAPDGSIRIATREFERNSVKMYLVVDPVTFGAHITEALKVNTGAAADDAALSRTPFISALERYANAPPKARNYGITASQGFAHGVFLTVDLCPSSRRLDKRMFMATERLNPGGGPAAVNIAVSGAWIEKHADDFRWLLGEERAGRLGITWINHSYTHPYKGDVPADDDFLAAPGVDIDKEVLANEALLIGNGVPPTPFFRFPGLVSNEAAVRKLRALHLIPIGANAWLAKGEAPVDGGFILVHGNGNEPLGIKRLLDFYRKKGAALKEGRLKLLPIKDAFIQPSGD